MVDAEEEAFKDLLKKKFELFKRLVGSMIEHELEAARITVEQARRMAMYTHETYFRHLRLYDFVLKNTKLSEVKRVFIPIAEPKCGDELTKAMVLADDSIKNSSSIGTLLGPSGQPSVAGAGGASGNLPGGLTDPLHSQDGTIIKDGQTM